MKRAVLGVGDLCILRGNRMALVVEAYEMRLSENYSEQMYTVLCDGKQARAFKDDISWRETMHLLDKRDN